MVTGKVCRFGEPVFGFSKVEGKGAARWSRMIFLGKSEPHDTYIFSMMDVVWFSQGAFEELTPTGSLI